MPKSYLYESISGGGEEVHTFPKVNVIWLRKFELGYNNATKWCNGYHHRKWTWRHEFKSWTRLIAFPIALIPLGMV